MTPEQIAFLRNLATVMGSQSARTLRAYLAERRMVEMANTVTHTKPVQQQQREAMAVANIRQLLLHVTGTDSNPVARIRALAAQGGIVAIINAVEAGKEGKSAEEVAEISRIAKILDLLYAEHDREGGEWPIPQHFGQPQFTTVDTVRVPASTHWEYAFPGAALPTEDQIDAALTKPQD